MIRTLDRVQYSKTAPQNTGVLWDDGTYLKIYRDNKWDIIGSFISIPDWNQNDAKKPSYILNRTHYIEGDFQFIDIKNCTTNTTILPNTTSLPIVLGNTCIDSYGEYTINVDGKDLSFLFSFREPVVYIGKDPVDLHIEVITNLKIKKLNDVYLNILSVNEVETLLEEIFDEQVN